MAKSEIYIKALKCVQNLAKRERLMFPKISVQELFYQIEHDRLRDKIYDSIPKRTMLNALSDHKKDLLKLEEYEKRCRG